MTMKIEKTIDFFDVPPPFEVREVAFEFEDRPGVFKRRPAVVIAPKPFADSVLVLFVKITSHKPRSEFQGEVILKDWAFAGLSKPSVARCSKLALIPIERLRNSRVYGQLSNFDARAVCEGLKECGILSEF